MEHQHTYLPECEFGAIEICTGFIRMSSYGKLKEVLCRASRIADSCWYIVVIMGLPVRMFPNYLYRISDNFVAARRFGSSDAYSFLRRVPGHPLVHSMQL